MTPPDYQQPRDVYSTDTGQQTQNYYRPQPSAIVPVSPHQADPARLEAQERARERQASTLRAAIVLVLAIPLTALTGGILASMTSRVDAVFLGLAMMWAAIIAVVWISCGMKLPGGRNP